MFKIEILECNAMPQVKRREIFLQLVPGRQGVVVRTVNENGHPIFIGGKSPVLAHFNPNGSMSLTRENI